MCVDVHRPQCASVCSCVRQCYRRNPMFAAHPPHISHDQSPTRQSNQAPHCALALLNTAHAPTLPQTSMSINFFSQTIQLPHCQPAITPKLRPKSGLAWMSHEPECAARSHLQHSRARSAAALQRTDTKSTTFCHMRQHKYAGFRPCHPLHIYTIPNPDLLLHTHSPDMHNSWEHTHPL